MNLFSGYPYWLIRNGFLYSYEACTGDHSCDIAIIGGGITSALIANSLAEAGADVIILDRRHIGMGSTSASTALLQFETDDDLSSLSEKFGFENAVSVYRDCINAITEISEIARTLEQNCQFDFVKSVYLASHTDHITALRNEYNLRSKGGIEASFLSSPEVQELFHFSAPGAIISSPAAQLDPFTFTHGIFQKLRKKNMRIFDTVNVMKITEDDTSAILHTDSGRISCRNYIFANGYEALEWLQEKVADLVSTFAVISKPVEGEFLEGIKPYVFWETARPYEYMRCTEANRIIIGGLDIPFREKASVIKAIDEKTGLLMASFQKKFPDIHFHPDFRWCGTFAESPDGLPFIGSHDEHRHGLFALGFGGNGITFSQVAATILRDYLLRNKEIAPHYRFRRMTK